MTTRSDVPTARERPEGGPDLLDAVCVLGLAYLPGGLALGALAGAVGGAGAALVGVLGFPVLLVACALGWVALRTDRSAHRVVGGAPRGSHLAAGVLAGVVLGAALVAVGQAAGAVLDRAGVEVVSPQEGLLELILTPGVGWVVALVAIAVTPVGEELVFRGVLHRGLRRLLPRAAAVGVSGLLFAVVHTGGGNLAGSLLVLGTLTVVGVALALLVERHGHVWSAVSAHAGYNAVGVGALLVL